MVLTDLQLGSDDGLQLARVITERQPELPVVVITAFGSMDAAIAAIRAGAYDFINKPIEMDALALTVNRAVAHNRLRREVRRLRDEEASAKGFEAMVGDSRPMKKVYSMLSRLAGSDAPVLVQGESGTGKELVARALHAKSDYADGPFVAINCAAVPENLLESTLFGHVRGAFTDAKTTRPGLFVEADGGTLFLDEIGEMPLEMQTKLLRAVQEKKVRPVGGSTEVDFDTRIVSATNQDLEDMVHKGLFREDLYYRIAVVTLDIAPLRRRGNDILLLAQHFLQKEAERVGKPIDGFTPDVARKLLDYEWPGNVRQLQNVVERAVALTRGERISVEDLPDKIRSFKSTQLVVDDAPEHMLTLHELERRYIERVLSAVGGNKTQAAKILGVDRRTLYRKLDRYEKEDARKKAGKNGSPPRDEVSVSL
jgi:two-component system response regulator HydG